MKTAIRKMGNSRGVIIPRPLLIEAGLETEAEMTIENGSIVLRPPRDLPRKHWAMASRNIAEQDASLSDWLEFAHEADAIEW
jgi:antitoxin MazE